MSASPLPTVEWVVLTLGVRMRTLEEALASIGGAPAVVVWNGSPALPLDVDVRTIESEPNLGVPEGRDRGGRSSEADLICFLDDDAALSEQATTVIQEAFGAEDRLGAVSLRLVDEGGQTARRHVPRLGPGRPLIAGEVTTFLGGACAIRREAYLEAGGYWGELFYGHEELELSWRLIDRGWKIHYLADVEVFHPRTAIGRHADGWRMTGRNRVMIARRTLPWPIAIVHVVSWLTLGTVRAPGRGNKAAYLTGWWNGWRVPVDRAPIRWRTVWRLTRLGRPPIV